MKVKIKLGDQEREVEISGLRRKHARDWLKKMRTIAEKAKAEDLSAVGDAEEFLDYQDEQAIEFSSLSKEEFDNLDIEEANKIISAIGTLLFPQSKGESLF